MEEKNKVEKIEYPWIVFTSAGNTYSITSKKVSSILTLSSDIVSTPQSADYMRGIMLLRGESIPLFDLRVFFNKPSRIEELDKFKEMLEARKADHVNWVNKFEKSIVEDSEITVGSDCHTCAFGKWFYGFKTNNAIVAMSLKKIEEPHCLLHQSVDEIKDARKIVDADSRKQIVNNILVRAKENYVNKVLKGIDDCYNVLADSFHELVLVIDGENPIGIIVDSVVGVENLKPVTKDQDIEKYHLSKYMIGVANTKNGIVVMLNEQAIIKAVIHSSNMEVGAIENEELPKIELSE